MITLSPSYFYNRPNVNFKCYSGFTEVKVNGTERTVNNYTTFFRDYPTLEFTKDYLLKNFPKGTRIAEFGCSTGQKPYSLMITLDKYNDDKKYKITGYDFPEVLETVKETPLFGLNAYTKQEQVLFDDYKKSELFGAKYIDIKDAVEYKKTFYKYFDTYKPDYNITGERYKMLKNLLKNNPGKHTPEIQKAKEDIFFSDLIRRCNTVVKANEKGQKLVEFKPGNINDIDKILTPRENGAVIFQNALYHVLSNNDLDYEINDLIKNVYKADALFKKINRVLPKDGIFVIGSLPSDHIYDFEREQDTHLAYQNGRQIRVYDSSPIHSALRANGFEPVFYENSPENTAYVEYRDVHLPSVWKKVAEA